MAATLASLFPEKAPELFAYQATIIRVECNYEAGRWVSYDRQYRREALARKDLNSPVTDPWLYNGKHLQVVHDTEVHFFLTRQPHGTAMSSKPRLILVWVHVATIFTILASMACQCPPPPPFPFGGPLYM